MALKANSSIQSVNNNITSECACTITTTAKPNDAVDMDAFFYIIVVIAFYSITIVFLLIKYNRKNDTERSSKYNYTEFVKRDRFQTAVYKNKLALEQTKAVLSALNWTFDEGDAEMSTNAPKIIVSQYHETDLYVTGEIPRAASLESLAVSETQFEYNDHVTSDTYQSDGYPCDSVTSDEEFLCDVITTDVVTNDDVTIDVKANDVIDNGVVYK